MSPFFIDDLNERRLFPFPPQVVRVHCSHPVYTICQYKNRRGITFPSVSSFSKRLSCLYMLIWQLLWSRSVTTRPDYGLWLWCLFVDLMKINRANKTCITPFTPKAWSKFSNSPWFHSFPWQNNLQLLFLQTIKTCNQMKKFYSSNKSAYCYFCTTSSCIYSLCYCQSGA